MNEIIMLRKLPDATSEHICQTCEHLRNAVQGKTEKEAGTIVFSTAVCPGVLCGGFDTKAGPPKVDVRHCCVHACPEYKFSKEVYEAYIKSDEWREIAAKRMKKDGYKCVMCGATINLCVHHLTYDNLGTEPLTDLITLCKKCHKNLHGKSEE